ncbi:hypothetical protein [Litorisediminicola beolgyonensis]|uniref:MAPEG family protein n=1 Tax=Litorisediminicola beolgyonensis TaxID=1173614 RepID=A0ABW3ZED0_9RHOB
MIWLSFIVNVVVLVPVLAGIWRDHPRMTEVFGPDTPARRVLACFYATILCASLAALVFPDKAGEIAHTLFPLQILYKLMSLPALGLRHPVARVNAAVAALHTATMVTFYT